MKNLFGLRFALNQLKKTPIISLTIITTLAITIGVLICVATLNYYLNFKPLPYTEEGSIYQVNNTFHEPGDKKEWLAFSIPLLEELYKNNSEFEESALVFYWEDVVSSLEYQPNVGLAFITPEYFSLFDAPMVIGNHFDVKDGIKFDEASAIISHEFWQNHFAGDADILQKKLTVDGVSYAIVGVLDSRFEEPLLREQPFASQIWLPWAFSPISEEEKSDWAQINSNAVYYARLNSNENEEHAAKAITQRQHERWESALKGDIDFANWRISNQLTNLRVAIIGDTYKTANLMLIAALGLLLIAASNLINIVLSRSLQRLHQFAVRATYGASISTLFKEAFIEYMLPIAIAVILAFPIASYGFILFEEHFGASIARTGDLSIGSFSVIVGIVVGTLLTSIFAYLTIRPVGNGSLSDLLQSSGKGVSAQVSKSARNGIIVFQVAVASFLVFSNLVLFNDAKIKIDIDYGIQLDNVYSVRLSFPSGEEQSQAQIGGLLKEVKSSLMALDSVESVSQSRSPANNFGWISITPSTLDKPIISNFKFIDEKYFSLLQQPVISGETFTLSDMNAGSQYAVVNEAFWATHYKDISLEEATVDVYGDVYRVIGVVKGVSTPRADNNTPRLYLPARPGSLDFMVKLSHNNIPKEYLVNGVKAISSQFSIWQYSSIKSLFDDSMLVERTTFFTTFIMIVTVLILACIGLYGIFTYNIDLRKQEVATRLSLGAFRKDIILMIASDIGRVIAVGLVISTALVLLLTKLYSEDVSMYLTTDLIHISILSVSIIAITAFLSAVRPVKKILRTNLRDLLK